MVDGSFPDLLEEMSLWTGGRVKAEETPDGGGGDSLMQQHLRTCWTGSR